MNKVSSIRTLAACLTLASLAACSGHTPSPPPPATYTIGGTVSGLASGGTVTLNDAGAGSSGAIGNGAFTLPVALDSGASYAVTATASTGETCTVTDGSGTVGSANVTNILVACIATAVPTYTIGGTVSGLTSGGTVTLTSAGAGSSGAIGNGAFTLPTALHGGAAYAVTATASSGETCTVTDGSGTVGSANVTNIVVTCAATVVPSYTLGGSVSGLSSGKTVTLTSAAAGSSGAIGNGAFTLPTALHSGATYSVTATASSGETCTVTNGSGTVASANVTDIVVACTATVAPTYTLGGIVSGLTSGGTVTLTSAGAGSSGAIGNGAFTLPTGLHSGTAYAVTATASTGETCTVTNGSGTVGSANVTNITVACTSSGSGTGGGTGFWMAFLAAPVSGTSGGKSGLFLIPSGSIDASPAPQPAFVTTHPATVLGLAFQGGQFSSPPTTSLIPALMMYAAQGADGNTHVYGLDLANPSNSSTVPTPSQITNLSIPASENICSEGEIETNAATPTTMQVVVYVVTPESGATPGTNGYCSGVTGGTYYVINYTDSSTTAPTVTTIPGGSSLYPALFNDGNFSPLNLSTGVLGGLLLWDSAMKDENFYTSAAFTSSTTLISGVTGIPVACVNVTGVTNGSHDSLGGSYLANVSTASGISAYQFTAAGAANQFFAGDTAACITDSTNLYFLGTPTGGSTQGIYEEPVTALSSPKTLLGGLTLATETDDYTIIGSNGSVVVFDNFTVSGTGSVTTTVMTVPVGVTSTSATTIGGPYTGALISDFLATPGDGSASGDLLFLTESNSTTSDNVTTVTFASQILTPGGAGSTVYTEPKSVWQSFGVFTTELSGYVLQISGITDTAGTYGGAKLNLFDTENIGAAPAPLTTSGGTAYIVPANTVLSVTGIEGTSVAEAEFFSQTTGTSFGAAVDVSKHAILPLTISNTNVTPVL